MATTIINSQKVEDFAKWKQGFDTGKAMRDQAGIIIKGIYQSVDGEKTVTVISEVSNPDMARAIMSAPEMKASMEKSGVLSAPDFKIVEQIF